VGPDECVKKSATFFLPNVKLQNAKFSTVTLPNFKSSNVQITEWPIVQHVISSNFMFSKRQIDDQFSSNFVQCNVPISN
jgi:hypothetical protein